MTDDTGRISRRSALALGPAAVAALALDGTDAMAQAAPDAPPPARAHGRPWKIAFEEHFLTSDFNPFPPSMQAALAGRSGAELQPVVRKLLEVGDARLALMDAAGIEYSILSLNTPDFRVNRTCAKASAGPARPMTISKQSRRNIRVASAALPRCQRRTRLNQPMSLSAASGSWGSTAR